MTRMTGPDCAVMCNLINTHIHTHTHTHIQPPTSSTIAGGRGCNIFVPVLGGNDTKIAPTGDIFHKPPGQMR